MRRWMCAEPRKRRTYCVSSLVVVDSEARRLPLSCWGLCFQRRPAIMRGSQDARAGDKSPARACAFASPQTENPRTPSLCSSGTGISRGRGVGGLDPSPAGGRARPLGQLWVHIASTPPRRVLAAQRSNHPQIAAAQSRAGPWASGRAWRGCGLVLFRVDPCHAGGASQAPCVCGLRRSSDATERSCELRSLSGLSYVKNRATTFSSQLERGASWAAAAGRRESTPEHRSR